MRKAARGRLLSSVCVIIPMEGHPKTLLELLNVIAAEQSRFTIRVRVYNNASEDDFSEVVKYVEARGWSYLRSPEVKDQDAFYTWIYNDARSENSQFYIQIPSRFGVVPGFFERALTSWKSITNPKRGALSLVGQVTFKNPERVAANHEEVVGETMRVSPCFLTERRILDASGWEGMPTPKKFRAKDMVWYQMHRSLVAGIFDDTTPFKTIHQLSQTPEAVPSPNLNPDLAPVAVPVQPLQVTRKAAFFVATAERPQLLAGCLRHLTAQQVPEGWHLQILVAGESHDIAGRQTVEQFRARWIDVPTASSVTAKMNACLRVTDAELVMLADDDDLQPLNRAAHAIAAYQSGADWAGSGTCRFFDLETGQIARWEGKASRGLIGTSLSFSTAMLREVEGWPEFKKGKDGPLVQRINKLDREVKFVDLTETIGPGLMCLQHSQNMWKRPFPKRGGTANRGHFTVYGEGMVAHTTVPKFTQETISQFKVDPETQFKAPEAPQTALVTCGDGGIGQKAFIDGLTSSLGFSAVPSNQIEGHLNQGNPVLLHGWGGNYLELGKKFPGLVNILWHSGWTGTDLMEEGRYLTQALAGVRNGWLRLFWLDERDIPPPGAHSLKPVWSPEKMAALVGVPPVKQPNTVMVGFHGPYPAACKNSLAGIVACRETTAHLHLSKGAVGDSRGEVINDLLRDRPHTVHAMLPRNQAVRLTASMTLMVHVSLSDTWPYMAMESVYAGTPVVVSDAISWVKHLGRWAQDKCLVRPATSTKEIQRIVQRLLDNPEWLVRLVQEQKECLDKLAPVYASETQAVLNEAGFKTPRRTRAPSMTSPPSKAPSSKAEAENQTEPRKPHGRRGDPRPPPAPLPPPSPSQLFQPPPPPQVQIMKERKKRTGKPLVLLLADVRGWAFDINLRDLASYLPSYEFDFWYVIEKGKVAWPDTEEFQAIYVPYHRWKLRKLPWEKALGSMRSRWFTPEKPVPAGEPEYRIVNAYRAFHAVSQEVYDELKPHCPNVCYLTNPVNMRRFPNPTMVRDRVIASWNGNAKHINAAGLDVKGFYSIVQPACSMAAVPLSYAEYHTRRLAPRAMPQFYRESNLCLSASAYEGASNSVMEAMAAGQALITTDVGNHREMRDSQLKHLGETGIILVDRTAEGFKAALDELKDNPKKVVRMGELNRQEIIARWSWDFWAERYAAFLRRAF